MGKIFEESFLEREAMISAWRACGQLTWLEPRVTVEVTEEIV